ncbi:MAG TPA: hypothetical protein VLX28_26105 [Thermoanaerobaculia bacterium]|nr:hypothetical protein [Thermoanaerobaculia bacterium]
MNATEEDRATTAPLMDRLDPAVGQTLEQAKELALCNGFPAIGAGHLALALLGRAGGWLDGLLQRRFGGLRAATVAKSLRDILELAADRSQPEPEFFRHFDRASYRTLVSLQIRSLVEEMAEKRLAVEVPPEAESLLASFAWRERQDGARQVRRLVNQHLRTQMADAILADRSRTRFAFVALEDRGEIRLRDGGRP